MSIDLVVYMYEYICGYLYLSFLFYKGTSSLDFGQQGGCCNPRLNMKTWNTMRQTGQDRQATESLEWSAEINQQLCHRDLPRC